MHNSDKHTFFGVGTCLVGTSYMLFKLFDTIEDLEKMLQNNEPRNVIAGGHSICVVRQKTNLVAFRNECPHMGEALSGGQVNFLNEIVCPLHTYKFNLQTGEEEKKRCSELVFIPVTINEEGVFLELA